MSIICVTLLFYHVCIKEIMGLHNDLLGKLTFMILFLLTDVGVRAYCGHNLCLFVCSRTNLHLINSLVPGHNFRMF